MKHNVGILIFGDPTRGGTIASEVKFLTNLYDDNNQDADFFIITVNPTLNKKVVSDKNGSYKFPHKIVTIFGEEDFHKLDNFSCILTYPGHSNFFGGYLNDNIVKYYKIVSKCTNELKIPVFVRINDSEIKVRDYRLMSEQRLIDGKKNIEENTLNPVEGFKPSAFMADPLNVVKAEDLVAWKQWDYSLVYWFANGSKDACDWVAETMYDREDEYFRMAPRQTFVDNAIYVSDDIFFLVRKNYDRLKDRYLFSNPVNEKLCYIGFFDTVNVARAKALTLLFKENTHKVPLKIFGKGTEVLNKFKDKPNVEIEEGFIKGDSDEYFDFLNSHLGYVFIGKGHSESRYIGKTVYDAVVARTPIVVYRKCDSKQITFSNNEFYFSDEAELKAIFERLRDSSVRLRWINEQAEEIFRKLPPTEFKFNRTSEAKPELPNEWIYVVEAVPLKPVKVKEAKIKKENMVAKTPDLAAYFGLKPKPTALF